MDLLFVGGWSGGVTSFRMVDDGEVEVEEVLVVSNAVCKTRDRVMHDCLQYRSMRSYDSLMMLSALRSVSHVRQTT